MAESVKAMKLHHEEFCARYTAEDDGKQILEKQW